MSNGFPSSFSAQSSKSALQSFNLVLHLETSRLKSNVMKVTNMIVSALRKPFWVFCKQTPWGKAPASVLLSPLYVIEARTLVFGLRDLPLSIYMPNLNVYLYLYLPPYSLVSSHLVLQNLLRYTPEFKHVFTDHSLHDPGLCAECDWQYNRPISHSIQKRRTSLAQTTIADADKSLETLRG